MSFTHWPDRPLGSYRAPTGTYAGRIREFVIVHLKPSDDDYWIAQAALTLLQEGGGAEHGGFSPYPLAFAGIRQSDSFGHTGWAARLIKEVIDFHYGSVKLTIACLCADVGVPERKMGWRFKQLFREKPGEYQIRARLERACYLLRSSPQLSIEEVGMQLGYGEPGDFSKFFRRHAGVTPREYRSESRCRYLTASVAS